MTRKEVLFMIKNSDVFNINFYKKEKFYGSLQKMRYRIAKIETEDVKGLLVTAWPGPYNYDTTEDALKQSEEFAFSNDGLRAAVDWLNDIWQNKYQ